MKKLSASGLANLASEVEFEGFAHPVRLLEACRAET